jgi:hypothetical protein
MKNNIPHIAVALVLVALLAALTDPFMLWMPPAAAMGSLVLAAALAGAWAGFVMLEKKGDEREMLHRMHADRFAYLLGAGILTVAILWQGFTVHHIDAWVAASLAAMVLGKLAARIWAQRNA